jgi:hypothetical protein
MSIYTPHPLTFDVVDSPYEIHLYTALRGSPLSRFARDLRREVSRVEKEIGKERLSENEQNLFLSTRVHSEKSS